MTLEQYITQFKDQYPTLTLNEDGVDRLMTPEEYEQRILDMATFAVQRDAQLAEEQRQQELRRKYAAARNILTQPVGTTTTTVRQAVVQHRTILLELVEILKESGLILDDA